MSERSISTQWLIGIMITVFMALKTYLTEILYIQDIQDILDASTAVVTATKTT